MRNTILFGILASAALATLVGCSGSGTDAEVFVQRDRLARPVINEVFATVAGNRHKVNNEAAPKDDSKELSKDVQKFMTVAAGRNQATTDVVKAVVVPDVLKVNLSQSGPASYLGVETNGATGGKFGGRKPTDDVIDISLGIVFGKTLSALGLVADDGKSITALTTDNVGPGGKHFTNTFPYFGRPN